MFGKYIGRLTCSVLLAVVWLGQAKVVTLRDGRKLIGEVTKTETAYHVKTRFGTVVCPLGDVVSVKEVEEKKDKDYEAYRASIDPKTAEDYFKLAKWAFEKKKFAIARRDLKEALKLDPKFERARLLLRRVEEELKEKPPTRVEPDVKTEPQTQLRDEWLVTKKDIYKIRLEELRIYRDRQGQYHIRDKVHFLFQNKVLDRFVDTMRGRDEFEVPGAEEAFRRWDKVRQAAYMLKKVDRDDVSIKDDILVGSDPQFMLEFRNRVWPIVEKHCAIAPCHGGPTGKGGLKLLPSIGRNEKVDYANFLILNKFTSGGYKMIDRGYPDLSLFLQHGLDRKIARKKHSKKATFTPPFPSTKTSNYQFVLKWIDTLQNSPRPDYRVKCDPPFSRKDTSEDVLDRADKSDSDRKGGNKDGDGLPATRPAGE